MALPLFVASKEVYLRSIKLSKSIYYLKKGEEKMIKQFVKFLKDEDGVTSVEYAVMAALIALVVIAGATILGNNTNATFEQVGAAIPGSGS